MDEAKRAAFEDLKARLLSQTNFRFAVCGPKGHSLTWTAVDRGNNYYVGPRNIMGMQKISFHGSGICQWL